MILLWRNTKNNQTCLVFPPGLTLAYYETFPFYEPIHHANPPLYKTITKPTAASHPTLLLCRRPARYYCKYAGQAFLAPSVLTNPFYATSGMYLYSDESDTLRSPVIERIRGLVASVTRRIADDHYRNNGGYTKDRGRTWPITYVKNSSFLSLLPQKRGGPHNNTKTHPQTDHMM